MKTITVKQLTSDINITWQDVDKLKTYSRLQLGQYYFPIGEDDDIFFSKFQDKIIKNWKRISYNIDISKLNKVVDVGCGIAVPDLLMSQVNKNTEFYLVDKNVLEKTSGNYYENNHHGYNSWDVVEDAISNSNINRSRFNFLSPESMWPEEVDLVLSTYSWCWHYPVETYWSNVMSSLKVGGKLAVDVLFRPDKDVIDEISNKLDSYPICIPTKSPVSAFKDQLVIKKDGSYGGFYIWTRNK